MSELEEKLGNILNNPQMMQQIMGMASMLTNSQEQQAKQTEAPKKPDPQPEPGPQIDMGLLQNLAGLMKQGAIDQNQLGLLKALQPYLSRDRIARLERAMHAARMANAASLFLNSGGLRSLSGR